MRCKGPSRRGRPGENRRAAGPRFRPGGPRLIDSGGSQAVWTGPGPGVTDAAGRRAMRTRAAAILAVVLLSAIGPGRAGAQPPNGGPFGFWGQVLSATDRWVVIQNQEGKEYPVDLTGSVRLFL